MRGFVAIAVCCASALIACYGGAFLPASDDDDDVPPSLPDADVAEVTSETSVAEGGSPAADASTVRRMFVTSTTVEGNFGGLTAADAECQTRGMAIGGRFKAWLSAGAIRAKDRFADGRAIVLLNGDPVADDVVALTSGAIAHPIAFDENGANVGGQYVWTGSKPDGTPTSLDCAAWTQKTGEVGTVGSTGIADGGWSNVAGLTCATPARLYCIEE